MNLSPKATRYVIEALDYYLRYHDQRLSEGGLSADEESDLTNDRQLLAEIKHEIEHPPETSYDAPPISTAPVPSSATPARGNV